MHLTADSNWLFYSFQGAKCLDFFPLNEISRKHSAIVSDNYINIWRCCQLSLGFVPSAISTAPVGATYAFYFGRTIFQSRDFKSGKGRTENLNQVVFEWETDFDAWVKLDFEDLTIGFLGHASEVWLEGSRYG